jgi:hypothetical protein
MNPLQPRALRLLALSYDIDAAIASIRLTEPLRALALAQGHALRLCSFHQATRADLAWADVAIVQRPTGARVQRLVERLCAYGTPWIGELDDLLTDVPPFLIHHRDLRAGAEALVRTLRQASAVTVPVERLACALQERLGPSAPVQHLVPNYAPPPRAHQAVHDASRAPRATLLLASSDTVRVDFVVPALRALTREPGLQVLAIGALAPRLAEAGIAVQSHPVLPRPAFLDLLAACVNPIGLIPLDDSAFSQCKSPIKFFDYAVAGVPTLCSRVSPYIEVVDDGRTGRLIDNDSQAWSTAVLELVHSPARRVAMVQAATAEVIEHHNMAQTVACWQAAISSVLRAAPTRQAHTLSMTDRALNAGERLIARLRDLNRLRMRKRRKSSGQLP